jgi:hypothetical protein
MSVTMFLILVSFAALLQLTNSFALAIVVVFLFSGVHPSLSRCFHRSSQLERNKTIHTRRNNSHSFAWAPVYPKV